MIKQENVNDLGLSLVWIVTQKEKEVLVLSTLLSALYELVIQSLSVTCLNQCIFECEGFTII